MTRVCLVGEDGVALREELLSYETARRALATYEFREPFANSLAVDTVSIGAAVSLLNDLNWYLVRLVRTALVLEPSVSDEEWLSRDLATAIRDGDVDPAETRDHVKVYGVERPDDDAVAESPGRRAPGRLVEPMYVRRVDGEVPEYDLRDVEETVVVRVLPEEFR